MNASELWTEIMGSQALATVVQDVIEEMCKHVEKPLVFPLSNPTSQAEITAENAYKHSKGKCIFAGGITTALSKDQ